MLGKVRFNRSEEYDLDDYGIAAEAGCLTEMTFHFYPPLKRYPRVGTKVTVRLEPHAKAWYTAMPQRWTGFVLSRADRPVGKGSLTIALAE